ncbi:unnamed protein product [Rodentolepis nana]|uniref:Zinc finger, C2H2 type n=1 Tax=Rodentolepis nana TaxID=102285 RepID=A0A0R3T0F2_RODNA|nr:unnamed protein product [Rodentolepis nana]
MGSCEPFLNFQNPQSLLPSPLPLWMNFPPEANLPIVDSIEDVMEQALDLSMKSSSTPSLQSTSLDLVPSSHFQPFIPFSTGEQDLSCPLCRKPFRFEKNLLRHLHKTHAAGNEESILKCKLCPYTTRHYSNMYVHIRTHTGDKPYSCSGCGASFTQGSSLKLHIKSRHDDNMSFFSLSRKPGKNNLTKLWTRVVRLDSHINLSVAQSSLYILPPQQLFGLTSQLDSVNTNNALRVNDDNRSSCGSFSVEALTSSTTSSQTPTSP